MQHQKLTGREQLIVSGLGARLLSEYDLQMKLVSERVHEEFRQQRLLAKTEHEVSANQAKLLSLLLLDVKTYFTIAFDFCKVVLGLGVNKNFTGSAVVQEVIKIRTEHARHAHKPSESNASRFIMLDGSGIRLQNGKRSAGAFYTRTFQNIEHDLIEARKQNSLIGPALDELLADLRREAWKVEFPNLPPEHVRAE